jgi:hypothetical protein
LHYSLISVSSLPSCVFRPDLDNGGLSTPNNNTTRRRHTYAAELDDIVDILVEDASAKASVSDYRGSFDYSHF